MLGWGEATHVPLLDEKYRSASKLCLNIRHKHLINYESGRTVIICSIRVLSGRIEERKKPRISVKIFSNHKDVFGRCCTGPKLNTVDLENIIRHCPMKIGTKSTRQSPPLNVDMQRIHSLQKQRMPLLIFIQKKQICKDLNVSSMLLWTAGPAGKVIQRQSWISSAISRIQIAPEWVCQYTSTWRTWYGRH